jgi:pimeloyl-ACP methyl ester carboxylesterase
MARWDAAQMDAAFATVRAPLMVIQTTTRNAELKRMPLKAGETSPWLDYVRAKIPAARIEVLPGLGHFAQLEAPQRVNQLIAEFAVSV